MTIGSLTAWWIHEVQLSEKEKLNATDKNTIQILATSRQREHINELEAYHGGKMRIMFPTRRSTLSHIFGLKMMVLLVLLSFIAWSVEASLLMVDCMKHKFHEKVNATTFQESFIRFDDKMRKEKENYLDATQYFSTSIWCSIQLVNLERMVYHHEENHPTEIFV